VEREAISRRTCPAAGNRISSAIFSSPHHHRAMLDHSQLHRRLPRPLSAIAICVPGGPGFPGEALRHHVIAHLLRKRRKNQVSSPVAARALITALCRSVKPWPSAAAKCQRPNCFLPLAIAGKHQKQRHALLAWAIFSSTIAFLALHAQPVTFVAKIRLRSMPAVLQSTARGPSERAGRYRLSVAASDVQGHAASRYCG